MFLLSSEALLATSTIANFKTDNITIWAHQDVEKRLKFKPSYVLNMHQMSPFGHISYLMSLQVVKLIFQNLFQSRTFS